MIGSVDNFDGQQNLQEWIQMVGRAAEFAGWTEEATFKAAMFRLRGEAGEHAEQLKAEGKIKTWKELQDALRERFETAGKEQWHQYLLNTGTQGSKTVQEWAQTVRKLSLRALGSEERDVKYEGQEPPNQEEERATETVRKEARRNLLDYMRRTNFVRGLRSNLRQMVWRKKCKTFDEAVKVAAEEEAVEASHREEEVLSCYTRGSPEMAATGLVERIVAALEMREEKKEAASLLEKEERKSGTARGTKLKTTDRGATAQSDDDYDEDEDELERPRRRYEAPLNRAINAPEGRVFTSRRPRYEEQLPLPRQLRAVGHGQENRREWRRDGAQDNQLDRDRALNLCFNCHRPGHRAYDCFAGNQRQQGNGYRRLL